MQLWFEDSERVVGIQAVPSLGVVCPKPIGPLQQGGQRSSQCCVNLLLGGKFLLRMVPGFLFAQCEIPREYEFLGIHCF